MPKVNVEIAESLPEPVEGQTYTITEAEIFTSQVRSYKGIRVSMEAQDGTTVVTALWTRDIAGEKSKLGTFISVLGNDTDKWIAKKIKFVSWRAGNRKIELVT